MRKKYFLYLLLCFCFLPECTISQNKKEITDNAFKPTFTDANILSLEQTGFIRCYSTEIEELLKHKYPNRETRSEFENWLAPKIKEAKERLKNEKTITTITIPVIFHIITDGTNPTTNVSQSLVQAQIDQLNIDFGNLAGSAYDVAADSGIRFCLAEINENGSDLSEIGIDRITNHGDGPFSAVEIDDIKTTSYWNPIKYMNIWTANMTDLLGYAYYPSSSGLDGIDYPEVPENVDGVVVASSSVGSIANQNPDGGDYGAGRTLTHEVGHWLGLLHTWGEGDCSVDDYCEDTPNTSTPNAGCPPIADSCSDPGNDMTENYMDYGDDSCVNTFTQDQVDRITAVMANSPRRKELASSNTCTLPPSTPTILFSSSSEIQNYEGSDCSYTDISIDLTLSSETTSTVTANLIASGNASLNTDYQLLNNSVTFNQGSTTASNPITVRISQDSFVESNETITLSINTNSNNDVEASEDIKTITILNDDSSSSSNLIFFDDFESYDDFDIAEVGGWTYLDSDGISTKTSNNIDFDNEGYTGAFIVFNPSATTPISSPDWNTHGGNKGYYCFNAEEQYGGFLGAPVNNDYIFTPQLNLNGTESELKFWAKGQTNINGGERFQVGISTTDTNPNSFTFISESPYVTSTLEWKEYAYDLSAYDGQNVYITIHVISSDEFLFMMDDFSVTTNSDSIIQEVINPETADNNNLNGPGVASFRDSSSNNIMLEVDNTIGVNFGCTSAWVSRDITIAGAAAVMYTESTNPSEFVTAKSFSITTENENSNTSPTVSFYFTETEIANWESITGNNRNNLVVKKEGINQSNTATITTFGDTTKLTVTLANGLAGNYYFGADRNSLNTNTFNHQNSFSIYPNPAKTVLNIKTLDSNIPDNYKIYNMLGQLIKAVEINSTLDLTINTTTFSNGMYFVKITKDTNSISIPFIKE